MILRRRWWPYFNFNLLLCWSRYRLKEEFRSFIGFFFLIHVTSIVLRVTETAMFQYKLMVNFFSFIFELVVKLDWGLRMRTFFFFFFWYKDENFLAEHLVYVHNNTIVCMVYCCDSQFLVKCPARFRTLSVSILVKGICSITCISTYRTA